MWTPFVKYLCIVLVLCVKYAIPQQYASPCPRLFVYDAKGNEVGKWYGIITLLSDNDLNGIWLRIILDRTSLQLGNWFGQVTTTDSKEFLIKNRNFTLKAHVPQSVRFFIKYDTGEPAPQLASFRLNAKTVCPENTQEENPPFIAELQTSGSNIPEVTHSPIKPPAPEGGDNTLHGIPGGFRPGGSTDTGDDDGVYPGDFNKPYQETFPIPTSADGVDNDCGTVIIPVKSQDQSTAEGQFPWHTALYYVKGIDLVYTCGGSLISKDHVISAAHCLVKKQSKTTLNPENLMIYFGKHYLRRWSNVGIQDRQVSSVTVHPNYNPQTLDNDIGILKLTESVDVTDYVRPICLWQESGDLSTHKEGSLTGWGYDESGKLTEELKQTKMSIAASTSCTQHSNPYTISKTMYCARFVDTTTTCVGNSGSGMAFPRSKSRSGRTVWHLRGIVALSVALQNRVRCDKSQYVIFADTSKHLDWIKQTMM